MQRFEKVSALIPRFGNLQPFAHADTGCEENQIEVAVEQLANKLEGKKVEKVFNPIDIPVTPADMNTSRVRKFIQANYSVTKC